MLDTQTRNKKNLLAIFAPLRFNIFFVFQSTIINPEARNP